MILFNFIFTDYECFGEGSINGYEHDPATSACACKPGWAGNKCQSKLKLFICIKYETMKCLFYELENILFTFVM